jgi:hypothetical protein
MEMTMRALIPGHRAAALIALAAAIFLAMPVSADDSANRPSLNKRQTIEQIIGCMRKRMSANQSRSYNEAMKICKDQINKVGNGSSSEALVASDAAPKL